MKRIGLLDFDSMPLKDTSSFFFAMSPPMFKFYTESNRQLNQTESASYRTTTVKYSIDLLWIQKTEEVNDNHLANLILSNLT